MPASYPTRVAQATQLAANLTMPAGLIDEGAGVRVQQTDDLALGDHDADRLELGYQARHGDLALMVLQQHEAAQFRPKVTSNFGRHWCEDGLPVGRQPAFPADTHDMRAQHEILDDEVFVALEARPGRPVGLEEALLFNAQPLGLALLGAALAAFVHRSVFCSMPLGLIA